MPVKNSVSLEDLPGYRPGMKLSPDTIELMMISDGSSVLYDPGDGGKVLVMPAKCAEHPDGVEGWLKAVNEKTEEIETKNVLVKLRRARLMVLSGTATGGNSFSLPMIREQLDLPPLVMDAVAQMRGDHYIGYRSPYNLDELIVALENGMSVRGLHRRRTTVDPDFPEEEPDTLEVVDVARPSPKKLAREAEQRDKNIDRALAYQGRCPSCGREPAFIFQDRAYCAEAERVGGAQREKHGWDVHSVSPSERKALERQMASWRRDTSVRFPKPERTVLRTPDLSRKEVTPVDLDALCPSSATAQEPSKPIDVDALPPAQLHTEEEPDFVQHMDEEVAEAVRENPEPRPRPGDWLIEARSQEAIAELGGPDDPREREDPGYLEDAAAEEEVTIEPDLPADKPAPLPEPEPPFEGTPSACPQPEPTDYVARMAAMLQDNLQADAMERMRRRLAAKH